MILLALETSTPHGSIAVLKQGALLYEGQWTRGKSHSELVTPEIERALSTTGLQVSEIEGVAVDQGPGSFTGIRVGINAARALSYALRCPVVPVTSLEALAFATPVAGAHLVCLLNAYKNLLFAARFKAVAGKWQSLESPHVLSIAALESKIQDEHICVGDGFTTYQNLFTDSLRRRLHRLSHVSDTPLARSIGLLALEKLKPDATFDWKELSPLYLRASEAEERLRE